MFPLDLHFVGGRSFDEIGSLASATTPRCVVFRLLISDLDIIIPHFYIATPSLSLLIDASMRYLWKLAPGAGLP